MKTVTFAASTSKLTLKNNAFGDCVSLKTIVLPERLVEIGDYAFQNCKSLNVTENGVFALPSKLKSTGSSSLGVGKGAFAGCETIKEFSIASSNEYFTTVNGLLYSTHYSNYSGMKDYYMLVAVPCSYDKAITLTADDGVIPYAFKFVKGINEITFAEGVTEIPKTILSGFTGLATVNLPSTVVKIGEAAFSGCTSLRNVNLPEGLETIDRYAFKDCAELKIIDLPSTLTTIGSEAFSGAGLTQVILPANLTSLGTSAFSNCANLETVVLNDLLEALPDSVFRDCVKLPAIDLKNVTSIGNNAFENAFTALAAEARPVITIPASIETLGKYLFKGAAVKEVKFDGVPKKDGVPTLPTYMFQNSTIERVALPEGLVTLPEYIFAGCKNVDIIYPTTLTTIDEGAFQEYEAEAFTVPSTVTTLDYYVFRYANIGTVTISDSVTSSKNQLFKEASVKKVVWGKGLKTIVMRMFIDSAVEEVVLPDTIVKIEDGAFTNTKKLKKLVIPAGVFFDTGSSSNSVFDGWTEDQTIYFRGSEDSYTFGPNWRGTGKMKVVFNYTGE